MAISDYVSLVSAPGGSKLIPRWVFDRPERDGWQRQFIVGGGGYAPIEDPQAIQVVETATGSDGATDTGYVAPSLYLPDITGIEQFQPEVMHELDFTSVSGLGGLLGLLPAAPAGPPGEPGAVGPGGPAGAGGGGMVARLQPKAVWGDWSAGVNNRAAPADHRHPMLLTANRRLKWTAPVGADQTLGIDPDIAGAGLLWDTDNTLGIRTDPTGNLQCVTPLGATYKELKLWIDPTAMSTTYGGLGGLSTNGLTVDVVVTTPTGDKTLSFYRGLLTAVT